MPKQFESTLASWQAAERLLAEGRVRAIGVCNFREPHSDALMARSEVVPALNQVELHPFLVQNELREVHRRLGIVTEAWAPPGGVNRYWNSGEDPLNHSLICRLAEQYGKTPAQIVLRWHLQRAASVIPKSVRPGRIAENLALFDFLLSDSDVRAIDALDQNRRGDPILTRVEGLMSRAHGSKRFLPSNHELDLPLK